MAQMAPPDENRKRLSVLLGGVLFVVCMGLLIATAVGSISDPHSMLPEWWGLGERLTPSLVATTAGELPGMGTEQVAARTARPIEIVGTATLPVVSPTLTSSSLPATETVSPSAVSLATGLPAESQGTPVSSTPTVAAPTATVPRFLPRPTPARRVTPVTPAAP